MRAVPRMQLVFFPLVAVADGETKFPPIQNLIGDAEVLGFTTYDGTILSTAPDGGTVVSNVDSPKLTVTFQRGTDQLFQNVPYLDLARSYNAGIFYEVDPFPIDLTKCSIRTNAAITPGSMAAVCFIYRPIEPRN